jgi:hypothetical protein
MQFLLRVINLSFIDIFNDFFSMILMIVPTSIYYFYEKKFKAEIVFEV